MTEAVKGLDQAAVQSLHARVHDALTASIDAPPPEDLGKLAALAGVREFPARVKCASLSWHTLAAALAHHAQHAHQTDQPEQPEQAGRAADAPPAAVAVSTE
jgi:nitrogen fixation NifU-like protein